MQILKRVMGTAMGIAGVGQASLKEAYIDKMAPVEAGVYKVFYQGQLMKPGKAEDGLRKRFSDYYRGLEGGTAGSQFITKQKRDQVVVEWKVCSKEQARDIEKRWYDEAKARGEEMPWAIRR